MLWSGQWLIPAHHPVSSHSREQGLCWPRLPANAVDNESHYDQTHGCSPIQASASVLNSQCRCYFDRSDRAAIFDVSKHYNCLGVAPRPLRKLSTPYWQRCTDLVTEGIRVHQRMRYRPLQPTAEVSTWVLSATISCIIDTKYEIHFFTNPIQQLFKKFSRNNQ